MFFDMKLGESTNDFLARHKDKIGLDPRIIPLVFALNDTGVVKTEYSCEGHFRLDRDSFCHHNHMAQVHFYVRDLHLASRLCDEILERVVDDRIDVQITQVQLRGHPDEPIDIQWKLEYIPIDFWITRPQGDCVYVRLAEDWTVKEVRSRLRRMFNATIRICKSGKWRKHIPPTVKP